MQERVQESSCRKYRSKKCWDYIHSRTYPTILLNICFHKRHKSILRKEWVDENPSNNCTYNECMNCLNSWLFFLIKFWEVFLESLIKNYETYYINNKETDANREEIIWTAIKPPSCVFYIVSRYDKADYKHYRAKL